MNRLLTLPTNIGQVRRNLPETNTLAYLPGASVTKREMDGHLVVAGVTALEGLDGAEGGVESLVLGVWIWKKQLLIGYTLAYYTNVFLPKSLITKDSGPNVAKL